VILVNVEILSLWLRFWIELVK